MKLIIQIFPIYAVLIFSISGQDVSNLNFDLNISNYFGLLPPKDSAEVFAPQFISTQYAEFAGTFSPNFSEYYFTRRGPFPSGIAQIMVSKKKDGQWIAPEVVEFATNNYEFEPYITPDGSRLYYGSKRSPNGIQPAGIMREWYLEKTEYGWSTPILLGSPFYDIMFMYPSVSNNGTMYFTSTEGIYFSELVDDEYQPPMRMGKEINFLPLTAHPYIAPDESYLIFDGQPRGEGKTDIFISYKKMNSLWTKGKIFDKKINSGKSQAIASVCPDGKFIFFTRNEDIYWISAEIINEQRLIPSFSIDSTNGEVPLKIKISTDLATVPDSIISFEWDFNEDNIIDSYSANPEFIYSVSGTYSIKLNIFTMSDSASWTFSDTINVTDRTTGLLDDENFINEFKLKQNYPNPFNPNTKINYNLPEISTNKFYDVKLKIYDCLGREIASPVDRKQKAGSYSISICARGLPSGIYFYKLSTEKFSKVKKMVLVR